MQGRRVLVFFFLVFHHFSPPNPQLTSSSRLEAIGFRSGDQTLDSVEILVIVEALAECFGRGEVIFFSLPWRIGSHLYYVSGFLMLGSPTFISHQYHPMDGRGKPQPDP